MLLVSCQSLGTQAASTAQRSVWGSTPGRCSAALRADGGLRCCTDAGAAVCRTVKHLREGCVELSLLPAGAQARNMPASPSAWSIKAGSETAARPQELVAHYTAQRAHAAPEVSVGDSRHPGPHCTQACQACKHEASAACVYLLHPLTEPIWICMLSNEQIHSADLSSSTCRPHHCPSQRWTWETAKTLLLNPSQLQSAR